MTAILALAFLLGGPALAGDEAGATLNERSHDFLFKLRRSTNDNEVIYEARTTPTGFLQADPIHVYWVLNATDGSTEPLTAFERSWAYGVSVESATSEEVRFALKALPDRPLIVRRVGADSPRAIASLPIAGKEARLERVYIETSGGGLIPKIRFIEIQGTALSDGAPVSERIAQ